MHYNHIESTYLSRKVDLHIHRGHAEYKNTHLILINDGQDLHAMNLSEMVRATVSEKFNPLIVGCSAAPHDGRKQEYGVQWASDYAGRGARAGLYNAFILQELLPWIYTAYSIDATIHHSIAGWSLGGLSAIDIAWHAPNVFNAVGMFSGSLWWRNHHLIQDDIHHRLMHHKVKHTTLKPDLRFWFQAGTEDEKADRNQNGIIDVIDDTLDLMTELEKKGYQKGKDMHFHIEEGGTHDVRTWSKVMPLFIDWLASA